MFEDEDLALDVVFDWRTGFTVTGPGLPPSTEELVQYLELLTLLRAMARGDSLLFEISKRALISSLTDTRAITYRQEVLADCLSHPEMFREMYALAMEAITAERKIWQPFGGHPTDVLHRAVQVLELFVVLLKRLRRIADDNAVTVGSKAMTTLFAMLAAELDDEYFRTIDDHLKRLKFRGGTLISAALGKGNKGVRYVLRAPNNARRSWKERVRIGPRTSYYFQLHPRDEAGARMLSTLNDRGLNLVANALAQSTDHILSFFTLLCTELGFYVSCLNLHELLLQEGEPMCTPVPLGSDALALSFKGIYDVCLALRSKTRVVGNEANADGKSLVMITGANSGGKSTLLRSIGLAQLMMQSGMFVAAKAFRANVGEGLFTHFIREEDDSMMRGKLDEELARMSMIADRIAPHSVVLFNESFAATNEREGSEIGHQIVSALLEAGVKVLFVTHQFTLADAFHTHRFDTTLFLRAERAVDGRPSFKLIEAAPLPTSFGEDIYQRIGGFEPAEASTGLVDGLKTADLGIGDKAGR
jgi:hypothetical protein